MLWLCCGYMYIYLCVCVCCLYPYMYVLFSPQSSCSLAPVGSLLAPTCTLPLFQPLEQKIVENERVKKDLTQTWHRELKKLVG